MRSLPALAAAAALLAVAVVPAAAQAASAGDYQLYVLGNLNMSGETFSRAVAAGGNAVFNSTSLNGGGAGAPSLVAGGDLTYSGGGAIANGALVGGANHALPYMTVAAGQSGLPVDFTAENQRLSLLSASLGDKAANGAALVQWGGLFLTGADSTLNVFNITTTQLAGVTWFNTDIAAGSQVLINVTGSAASLSGGLNFYTPGNILWNFVDATSIAAGGLSLSGSVLAPKATFNGTGGTITGDVIVGGFNGRITLAGSGYGGTLLDPPVRITSPVGGGAAPEPAVWAMMILGFGGVGALLRHRRSRACA